MYWTYIIFCEPLDIIYLETDRSLLLFCRVGHTFTLAGAAGSESAGFEDPAASNICPGNFS